MKSYWFIIFCFVSSGLFSQSETYQSTPKDTTEATFFLRKALKLDQAITISLPPEQKLNKLQKVQGLLNKAYQLDSNKDISVVFKSVAQQYFYTGVELFNKAAYPDALKAFENNIKILSRPEIAELDTMTLFNAGIAAEKSRMYDKAEYYYQKLIRFHYDTWSVYIALANLYKVQNKTPLFFKTIEEGSRKYPEDQAHFTNELLSYYLEKEQYDSALTSVNSLIKSDSLNPNLLYLKGSIYHQKGNLKQAETFYRECLKSSPNNADAAFNLSSILYNKALDLSEENSFFCKHKRKIKQYCSEILEHLNIVAKETPNDIQMLNMMLFCHYQLKNKEQEKTITEKIKQLKTN